MVLRERWRAWKDETTNPPVRFLRFRKTSIIIILNKSVFGKIKEIEYTCENGKREMSSEISGGT